MSYYKVLGLDCEPFSMSPDPAFFYETKNHKSALANLIIEMYLKRGLSVIIGDVGTGKTTLGRKMIQMLRDRQKFDVHLILDPSYPSEELFLHSLIRTFGITLNMASPSIIDYKEALEQYLLRKGTKENVTVVLMIDEAQKLSPMMLEILRILLNYETNEYKLLQLVLFAQVELIPHLVSMPNLLDRISMKYVLQPLGIDEMRELIGYRLRQAGYRSRYPLFEESAVREIHHATHGYPRKISMLCHKSLKEIVMRNQDVVTGETVEHLINQEIRAGWQNLITPLQKSSSLS